MRLFFKKGLFFTLLGFSLLALSACGGGGGGSTAPAPSGGGTGTGTGTGTGGGGTTYNSEGSKTGPVLLTLDAPHSGTVGGLSAMYTSYYYFHTNTAGGYLISLTNTHSDLAFTIYSNAFTTSIDTCNNTTSGDEKSVYNLAANTDYYVSVMDVSFTTDSYTITASEIKSEGTQSAPVSLSTGSHAGSVDGKASSYYSFTPGTNGSYTFTVGNALYADMYGSTYTNLQFDAYSNADFSTGRLATCSAAYGPVSCTVNNLTSSSPCYIKITEKSAMGYDTVYSITSASGISEGTPANPVTLTVGTPHAGGVDAGSNLGYSGCTNPAYSYYSFSTAAGAGGYTVTTDNSSTVPVTVDIFAGFGSTALNSCTSKQGSPCMFSNLDPNGTYYLRIGNCNNADVTYNIKVVKEGSEGSVNSPVALQLETAHTGNVGYYETSYYTFKTDISGSYNIILDQPLQWAYGALPDFSGYSIDSGSGNSIYSRNLDANTTYYLKVSNLGTFTGIQPYTIKVVHGYSEGSIANPISLSMGTAHGGKVGSSGRSYYTFTTPSSPATADYYVKFDNATDLWGFAYTNPDFTNGSITSACNSGPGTYISCILRNAPANTPYYIEAQERDNVNATYNMNIYLLDPLAGCSVGSECYNFEDGLFPASFTKTTTVTGSASAINNSYWKIDITNNAATGGTKSLKSGSYTYDPINLPETCVQYTRTTSANSVLFSYKTDTYDYFNKLVFSIDGTVPAGGEFSSTPSWRRAIFFPTSGQHTYKWCFTKGISYISGADAVWVDDIEFK